MQASLLEISRIKKEEASSVVINSLWSVFILGHLVGVSSVDLCSVTPDLDVLWTQSLFVEICLTRVR